jgi:beta-lactamase superfamily II metal-dependent hydrolase
MARKKKRKNNKNIIAAVVAALCLFGVFLMFALGSRGDFLTNLEQIWENTVGNSGGWYSADPGAKRLADLENNGDKLIVYAIDTGNSDSIIIRTPEGRSMLVDAADTDDYTNISKTLKALGIEQLDAVVATTPTLTISFYGRYYSRFSPSGDIHARL